MIVEPTERPDVELNFDGREYGAPLQSVRRRNLQEPSPEIGKIFIEDIVAVSAILALPDKPTRQQILDAYGKDVHALGKRRQEADGFMLAVLRCGMERAGVTNAEFINQEEVFKTILQPLGITPQLDLTAEAHALPFEELAKRLKKEFQEEVDRIARRVATSLDCLAEHDVVGLIDWKSSDVCKFHFFRWDIVSTTTVSHKHEGDIMSWNTLVTTSVKTDEINQTRHVHHLVNAAMHTVADYSRPMPERITKLIAEAPFWLKPHLVIVDGTETLCEVIKKKVGVVTRRNVESVLRYDPAVALGRLVLGGWGESEIATKVANEKEADSFMNTLGAFVGLMLLIVLVAAPVISLLNAFKAAKANYGAYIAKDSQRDDVHTIIPGQKIELPIPGQLVYVGQVLGGEFCFSLDSTQENLSLTNRFNGGYYGDLDLRKSALKLPIVLHVHAADVQSMNYTVEQAPSNK